MSLLVFKKIPTRFQRPSMRLNLHDSLLLPFTVLFFLVLEVTISLSELGIAALSYGVLAIVLASFVAMLVLVVRDREITRFGFVHFLFFFFFISVTLVSGTDIRNAIYNSVFVWLMLLVVRYYRDRIDMVMKCITVAFSVCVLINFAHLVTHPMMWLVRETKDDTGYLFGINYNQMGCRMMVALAANALCMGRSRVWTIHFIVMAIIATASLAMVGSMTSLSMIVVFLLFCLVPSSRLRKVGIYSLFTLFVLFQVFVVFNGRGLENNDLAVYLVEDVLHKDLTFTNRTSMWESALDIISQSPLWGWGFPDADWFRSNMASSAIGPHNFILSVLINGGIILLGVYLWICAVAVRTIWPYMNERKAQLLVFAVACLWFMSLMEMYSYPIMFFPLIFMFYYPYLAAGKEPTGGTEAELASDDDDVQMEKGLG